MTAKQRTFAQLLVQDPDRCGWKAAWRAGYSGGGPDKPLPEAKRKRQTVVQSAHQALKSPRLQAYIEHLEAQAAAAFLASPEGAEVQQHIAAREAGQADLEALAAQNLAIMVAIAHHDMRSAVRWGQGWVEVAESDDLTYEEQLLVREVRHEERFDKNGDRTTTTVVKLADRGPYVKMLEARFGKLAPVKHEVSGPGGGAIQHDVSHELVPPEEAFDHFVEEVLGVRPATAADAGGVLMLEEVEEILRRWELDGDPHVARAPELFAEENWEETRSRYLEDV